MGACLRPLVILWCSFVKESLTFIQLGIILMIRDNVPNRVTKPIQPT